MSSTALIALLLLIVAATFWRPLRRVRTAVGMEHLISTGYAFLILGCLIGLAFGDRPTALAEDIAPIMALVAGWIGYATGMRFELRVLRAVPRRAFVVALFPAIASAAVAGLACLGVLTWAEIEAEKAYAASLLVAAAAASSGPTLAAVLRTRRAGRSAQARSTLRMIEFSAGMGDAIVVPLSLLAFCLFRPVSEPIVPAGILAMSVGGGALLGVVTWLFLGGRAREDERLLLGLAMLAFTAGFGGWLLVSPAAVSAIAAMVLANLPGNRMEQLFQAVRRVERPAVVILMILVGIYLADRPHWLLAPLLVIMTLVRMTSKHWAGERVVGPVPGAPGLVASPGWAQGLASQGTLGLMMSLSYFQMWRDDLAHAVLCAVAVAGVINELLAPALMARMLRVQQAASAPAQERSA